MQEITQLENVPNDEKSIELIKNANPYITSVGLALLLATIANSTLAQTTNPEVAHISNCNPYQIIPVEYYVTSGAYLVQIDPNIQVRGPLLSGNKPGIVDEIAYGFNDFIIGRRTDNLNIGVSPIRIPDYQANPNVPIREINGNIDNPDGQPYTITFTLDGQSYCFDRNAILTPEATATPTSTSTPEATATSQATQTPTVTIVPTQPTQIPSPTATNTESHEVFMPIAEK